VHKTGSEWTTAWTALLICLVAWITLDHKGAGEFIDAAIQRWDITQILTAAFLVFAVFNLFALAIRILTWRNE
jgi:hypothetical protein